jgi:hypothetical protein
MRAGDLSPGRRCAVKLFMRQLFMASVAPEPRPEVSEVSQLRERFRSAVVLCDLEGKSSGLQIRKRTTEQLAQPSAPPFFLPGMDRVRKSLYSTWPFDAL